MASSCAADVEAMEPLFVASAGNAMAVDSAATVYVMHVMATVFSDQEACVGLNGKSLAARPCPRLLESSDACMQFFFAPSLCAYIFFFFAPCSITGKGN
mmetsp:Transcript_9631/g.17077  ORF Transcript_9631/g.17077 Transcript_9631/m.17077 type:complete len:99 (-) Transcript_9631:183-479(-)